MTGIALSQASLLNAQALGMMTGMVGHGVGISSTEVPLTLTLTHSGAPTQVLIPEVAPRVLPPAVAQEVAVESPTWWTLTTSAPMALVDLDLDPLFALHTYRSTTAPLTTSPEHRSMQSDRVWRRPVSARELAQQAAELSRGNAPTQVDEGPIDNGRVARDTKHEAGSTKHENHYPASCLLPPASFLDDRTRSTEIVFLDAPQALPSVAAQRDSETAGPVVQSEDYPPLEVGNDGLRDQRLPSDSLRFSGRVARDVLFGPFAHANAAEKNVEDDRTRPNEAPQTSSDALSSGIALSLPALSSSDTIPFPTAGEASFAGIESAVGAPEVTHGHAAITSTWSAGWREEVLLAGPPRPDKTLPKRQDPALTVATETDSGGVILPFPQHRSVSHIRGTDDPTTAPEGTHGEMPALWQSVGRTEPPAAAQTHWRLVARLTETGFAPPYAAEAPGLHRDGQSPVHPLFGALPERDAEPEPAPEWDEGLVARIRRALEKAGFIDKATGALRELTTAQDGIALSDVLIGLAEADLGGLYVRPY